MESLVIREDLLRAIIIDGAMRYFSEKAVKEFDFSELIFTATEDGKEVFFDEIEVGFNKR